MLATASNAISRPSSSRGDRKRPGSAAATYSSVRATGAYDESSQRSTHAHIRALSARAGTESAAATRDLERQAEVSRRPMSVDRSAHRRVTLPIDAVRPGERPTTARPPSQSRRPATARPAYRREQEDFASATANPGERVGRVSLPPRPPTARMALPAISASSEAAPISDQIAGERCVSTPRRPDTALEDQISVLQSSLLRPGLLKQPSSGST